MALPDLYTQLQLDNMDRYHVGLYRWRVPRLVEIIEPGAARGGTSTDAPSPSIKITKIRWPRDPVAAFDAAVARYQALALHFGKHRN